MSERYDPFVEVHVPAFLACSRRLEPDEIWVLMQMVFAAIDKHGSGVRIGPARLRKLTEAIIAERPA